MDDKINLHCQKCGHDWDKSLAELQKLKTTVYRDISTPHTGQLAEYRAACPNCGSYLIATVQED